MPRGPYTFSGSFRPYRCVVLRIDATPDWQAQFGDFDIAMMVAPVFPNEVVFGLSAHYPASCIRFVYVPAGVEEAGGHTPSRHVLAMWLDGVVEVETSEAECSVSAR